MQTSSAVLAEIMEVPLKGIPRGLLARAHGIAIIPNMIKGGFVIGARHGTGVLILRESNGQWRAPVFISMTGGSLGFQAGVQSTDVVLVFTRPESVQQILTGKFTLGADAAAAAGPVGRQGSAATDLELKAEIYSYSRSRGLFAGVALDGSVLQVDSLANAAYYHHPVPGQPVTLPASAAQLLTLVAKYTGSTVRGPQPAPAGSGPARQPIESRQGVARGPNSSEADHLRDQLAKVAPELFERLDDQWDAYLALPAEIFTGQGHPAQESLSRSIARFKQVDGNPQYRALAENPQFQSTYGLLKHYHSVLVKRTETLQLPKPPGP